MSPAPTQPPPVPQGSVAGIQRAVPFSPVGGSSVPIVPVGSSGAQLMPLMRSSVTQSTWQAYGKAWSEWSVFASDRPVMSCDASRLEATCDYLFHLFQSGFSGSVAQHRLSGVSFHFRLRGWPDVTKVFFVRQVLKGWKRSKISVESRRPISISLLQRLIAVIPRLCSSPFESALFSAAFALAFFGALRIGELVPLSKNRPGGLRFDDVSYCDGGLRIRIRKSKTDPAGIGSWVPLYAIQGAVCPRMLVATYLSLRRDGFCFFSHEDGSPLTRFQFLSIFRKCLCNLGLHPAEFGTHSFRIGAATEAARAGLSNQEIQRIGRWRSSCFARYIRPELLLF
ncbi:uncharacterized protein ACNLHF_024605 [Anomaloglossus baeobatrachus]|uniref:uncharacterized protein LOC142244601 n=1 Tax=Anomaloglossus baeobatrachus TaxID=238106 RepID=UPI003F505F63